MGEDAFPLLTRRYKRAHKEKNKTKNTKPKKRGSWLREGPHTRRYRPRGRGPSPRRWRVLELSNPPPDTYLHLLQFAFLRTHSAAPGGG